MNFRIRFYTIKGNLDDGKYSIYIIVDDAVYCTYLYEHVTGKCSLGHTPAGMILDEVLEMSDKELSSTYEINVYITDWITQRNLAERAFFQGLRLAQLHIYQGIIPSVVKLRAKINRSKREVTMDRMLSNIRKVYKNFHPDAL